MLLLDKTYDSYNCKTPFSNNHDKTLKSFKNSVTYKFGDYTVYLGSQSEVKGRKSGRILAWGSAFIRVQGGGLGFHMLTEYW